MKNIKQEKEYLRYKYLKLRKDNYSDELNDRIIDNLLSNDYFKKANSVLLTSSINSEINTFRIIHEVLGQGKAALFPRTNKETKEMEIIQIKNYPDDFVLGNFNILEPKVNTVWTKPIDLILVPGLLFDLKGNRIGYGGGFYDRFLSHNDSLKVSITSELFIKDKVPTDSFDIPVDLIITENRSILIK